MQKIKNIYHLSKAVSASILNGFPSESMEIIGVTGTDGKTTTASMIYHILQTSGKKAALLTSVSAIIDGTSYDTGFHVTTPNSYALQKYLKKAKKAGVKYFVLETTSHALDQHRVWGITYQVGVLTNITHEHLDYHKTYDSYLRTKSKLLLMSKTAVVNRDDGSFEKVTEYLKKKKYKGKVITYGLDKTSRMNPKSFPFTLKLTGAFNQYNALAAITACDSVGIEKKDIQKALLSYTPPIGRQDMVYNKDFKIMIDFAHTPHSFEMLLPELKKQTTGRLIHVFGAASKRDVTKRPLMGMASAKSADIIILTAEDPRGEDPVSIAKEIATGISNLQYQISNKPIKKGYVIIPDRKEAIEYAIKVVERGDTIVLTGKSHEKSMNYSGVETPWDEYQVVNDALEAKRL